MSNYASKAYWNKRYERNSDKQQFEWFQKYESLQKYFSSHIRKGDKILIVGCGNSSKCYFDKSKSESKVSKYSMKEIGGHLFDDGYTDIVNIDFSNVVIEQMKEVYGDKTGMEYIEMDVTCMQFSDNFFDVIIDKATLDSLLCADGASRILNDMIKEIFRVLKPKGKFLLLSYAKGQTRLNYLNRQEYSWNIEIESIAKMPVPNLPMDEDSSFHYLYICQKELPRDISISTAGRLSENLQAVPSNSGDQEMDENNEEDENK